MGVELKNFSIGFVFVLMAMLKPDYNEVLAEPQVPCYFIFGDSLVDNGNNNGLASFAKANYLPYGIDFAGGSSGRFSNGKTLVDIVAELLGFNNEILPYSRASGKDIQRGVNYASAAAGIRDETGYLLGARSSFTKQVNNYKNTVSQMARLLGGENSSANYLNKCIYSIGLGSNDYLNNYFMPFLYWSSIQYTPEQYADVLIQRYSRQLRRLYIFGARKFVLNGLGQIGCVPSILIRKSPDGKTCVAKFDSAIRIFNKKLKDLVDFLNNQQKDAKYIYVDTYGIFEDIKSHLSAYGLRVTNTACCGVGRNNALFTCLPFQVPCPNRNEYLFWDAFHPTEVVNTIVGRRSYHAMKGSDAYPMDIRRLAQS